MSDATPMSGAAPGKARDTVMRVLCVIGGAVGYGCLAAFLYLVTLQLYRWFRDGEWSHFGVSEGLRIGLTHCCVKEGDTGRLAALVEWLDAPVNWLGLHKVLEIVPASLGLFALSIFGNFVLVYCRDRIGERRAPGL